MKCFVISYSSFLKIDRSVRGRAEMPKDIKYNCQVLIKSKITRDFDMFPWFLMDIFTKNPNYYFYFVYPFQKSSELIKFGWFLNQIPDDEFWLENRHRHRSDSLGIRNFSPKVLRWLSVYPSIKNIVRTSRKFCYFLMNPSVVFIQYDFTQMRGLYFLLLQIGVSICHHFDP